ncbi:MAG TPA: hypothetical protein VI299_26090 [Polyangiales bacterium]
MPLVSIGGHNYNVTPEDAPNILPNQAARNGLPLSDGELANLANMRGFGRADWSGDVDHAGYADHAGSRSYGCRDDDYVITDAACWNWALTGATIVDRATQVTADGMFTLNTLARLPDVGGAGPALAGLDAGMTTFYNANTAAVNAWLAMAEGTAAQKHTKVEALVRIMCVAKRMTLANGPTRFEVCCEYSVTLEDGSPAEPNFDHWGLQIDNAYSLQTIPDPEIGIWKNSQQSFVNEWSGGTRAVVAVPVATLTAAHIERIRGILAWNPVGAPRARRLRCSVGSCARIHGSMRSVINLWHQCRTCHKVFCDDCGRALPRPAHELTRERQCPCGGRTALLSAAAA